ncbi:MAG: DHHA1 domain-containing protein [Myxococcota bacterium]
MGGTERLYWQDPYARAFEATVTEVTPGENGEHVVTLEQTLFYPEAGGQRCDVGTLGGAEVLHVDDDNGVLRHRIRGPAPERGQKVTGQVDWARRFDMMQQHTAQHILSAGFHEVLKAATVSARLGERGCTIDLGDLKEIPLDVVFQVEDRINQVIWDDRAVRAHFPSPEELARMPLRRTPKVDEGIRVIEVEEFDFSPCGGTHVRRTGELGAIRVLKTERYKGGIRAEFCAGSRALREAREKAGILEKLGAMLSSGAPEVAVAVEKLQGALRQETRARSELWGELVQHLAGRYAAQAVMLGSRRAVVAALERRSRAEARTLAMRLTADDPTCACALVVEEDGRPQLVVSAGAQSGVNAGAVVKRATTEVGGRGGGKPELAEGAGPAGGSTDALLDAVRKAVSEM